MMEPWTVSEEEYERRTEQAREVGWAAAAKSPGEKSWGFFSYGDAPGAIGGGVGQFQWYESREEMLEYVRRHLTFLMPGQSSIDPGRVAREVEETMANFSGKDEDLENLRLKLNKSLRTFSIISWWGTFPTLLQSDESFPASVRSWCREEMSNYEEEGTSEPIADEELDDFLTALHEYGM